MLELCFHMQLLRLQMLHTLSGVMGFSQHTQGGLCGIVQVTAPLAVFQAMPSIKLMDFRGVHEDPPDVGYWTDSKCNTMRHLANLTKKMKQRPYGCKVLMDKE